MPACAQEVDGARLAPGTGSMWLSGRLTVCDMVPPTATLSGKNNCAVARHRVPVCKRTNACIDRCEWKVSYVLRGGK